MEISRSPETSVQSYEVLKKTHDITKKEKESEQEKVDTSTGTDKFIKSDQTDKNPTYDKVKKLTKEQVQAIREERAQSQQAMLEKMMETVIGRQANQYSMSKGSQDLITEIFGSFEAGLPPIATTPEEAQKAIEPGGAYSVEAVADRIMKMAQALSGNDPSKIQELRDAVKQGFKQAGMDFGKMTDGQKLPQICMDTYDEIMKRFDTWEKESAVA